MRIEEHCGCGARLVIVPETRSYHCDENRRAERDGWKQIDRWRKLHAACRVVKPAEGKAPDGE